VSKVCVGCHVLNGEALIDFDQVHGYTAASVVKYAVVDCVGLDCENAMTHLLNLLWLNLLRSNSHVMDRIVGEIEDIRNTVGTPLVMNYVWVGRLNPARPARSVDNK